MSSNAKRRIVVLSLCLFALTGFALVPDTTSGQQIDPPLAERAKALLTERCFQCHGQNGRAAKNIFVLERARLIAAQIVLPKDANSPLLNAVESGAMPLNGTELTREEKAVLRNWILQGALDWETSIASAKPRSFLSEAMLFAIVRDDLERAPTRVRPFLRYFSLAHLSNAGVADEELESFRTGLAKLLNSLSWHREIALPVAIDPARTLLRIDLRDYQWTTAHWQKVMAAYPYGLLVGEGERIARLSGETVSYVRADWFVAQASVPPLFWGFVCRPAGA